MPLGKDELDHFVAAGCGNPECDHNHLLEPLYLHGACHPGGMIEVSYIYGTGVMRIGCKECGETIANIKVGKNPKPAEN